MTSVPHKNETYYFQRKDENGIGFGLPGISHKPIIYLGTEDYEKLGRPNSIVVRSDIVSGDCSV